MKLHSLSGLNIEKDTILEIAVIITDGKLNHSIEAPPKIEFHWWKYASVLV